MIRILPVFTFVFLIQCQALINLKVPPITITNAQTAAEKQMVGEDRDLEKDGWLVSSIQSSSGGANGNKQINTSGNPDSDLQGNLLRIQYLTPEVKRYKMHWMIGEGIGGILKLNPIANTSPFYSQYENPAKKKRIEDVVLLINESRKTIIEKQLEAEKKKGKKEEELSAFRLSLIDSYQKSVLAGEFYESKPGKWERM
ncbi:DUF1318 domain-containing protein [Leptospira ilyithenensis]|uniref:DUF1318 domain-containing protein n=1 Tax=Leptospira ilyithenensis TaxID=2484901 RepID=A0A4R9LQY4_9LEPT|nr:DUF1318 domain-containing protein [Leptospira ilyithenensis]TGN10380.1 DUF1318 domain-containing protein [Leptospira ilyithenensis]